MLAWAAALADTLLMTVQCADDQLAPSKAAKAGSRGGPPGRGRGRSTKAPALRPESPEKIQPITGWLQDAAALEMSLQRKHA